MTALGEMTPEDRAAVIQRAAAKFQAELTANADAIGAIMDAAEKPARYTFAYYHSRWQVILIQDEADPFNSARTIVANALSEAKAKAIAMILNSPEPY